MYVFCGSLGGVEEQTELIITAPWGEDWLPEALVIAVTVT